MLYEDLRARDISKKLKISNQAVYKNINAGALDIVAKLTTEIEKKINKILNKT